MAVASNPSVMPVDEKEVTRQLRTSSYDQASGMLVALLLLIGFGVVTMFLIWASKQVWFVQRPIAISLVEEEPGGGGNGAPMTNDLQEPVPEEIEQVEDPPVEVTIEAITDVVTIQAAVADDIKPMYQGRGQGRGTGDGRGVGPGGDGTADIIPRWERWVIKYSSESTDAYARQLDAFGIELGAVGGGAGGQNVDYASAFSGGNPKRRSGAASDEKRLYMTWRNGALQEADLELLGRAGVPTAGRIVMQLYPKEIEDQLALLERERSGGRDVKEILKTVFAVRGKGGKYVFEVTDQFYRTPMK
ncbi:MAG: hypothetical protein U0935_17490 [Pirellulales bacterium]